MFQAQDLTEKAGYEYWVLRKCLLAIEKHRSVSSDVTVVFHKDGTKEHILQMYSEFGSEKRVQVIEDLSPLLFVSSYKMIDMYIEWLLDSNGLPIPRRFDQKYQTCRANATTLALPSFISQLDHGVLLALYDQLRLKRNYIIHGSWGRTINGDLQFDYTDRGMQDQDCVAFKTIVNLSELVVLLYDRIHNQHNAHLETSFRFLSDQLFSLHQSHSFGITRPRFYEVIMEANDGSKIELQPIRDYFQKDNMNQPFSFNMTIRTPSKEFMLTDKE